MGEQTGQTVENIIGPDAACHSDRQAFPGVLVDQRQHPEGPAIMGAVSLLKTSSGRCWDCCAGRAERPL